ncbi:sensor histidine kinase [Paenibacillus sp. CF384]|uniref:cache domain-containing sensor histidine kinase n=1 Tax=Paenibacillus sp. CF384 TaxID=1884382 RepID=UPI000898F9C2|nr:sensor histidine kinase [Paenibacillus sp. CF384]SDX49435.1 Histidine kinase-, DNA gyrase B-, and HSP90-like ATPase [Paenibacillus sp. CF384]
MMKWIKVRSLKYKIILVFIIISFLLVILQAGFFQHWISGIILRQSEANLQETVRQIGKQVDLQYKQIDANARVIRNNQVLKNYLKDLNRHTINYQIAKYQIARQIVRLPNLEMIENIYIFPVGYAPMNLFYSDAIFEADKLTEQLMTTDRPNRSEDVIWAVQPQTHLITMMMLIYDGEELLGLLRVDLNEKFHDQLDDVRLGDEGSVFLLKDHTIMFATDRRLVNLQESSLAEQLDSGTQVTFTLDYQGWKLIGVVPNKEILSQVNQVNKVLLLMELIVFAFIFLFALVILRMILRPLKQILRGMESIEQGKLDVIVNRQGNDEFSVIIRHFNHMAERVNRLIKTVYYQQLTYRKAEVINLQSKLNPHFLYNTLDMIYWMTVVKDEDEIGEAIISLSTILRYSISHQNEFVTVSEDMEQLENYLKIQRMRFEDKLSYVFHIDPAIAEIKIPKLLIQPLVENAIKYAFQQMMLGGIITIQGYTQGDDLYLEVVDNGIGMPAEKVEALLASFENKSVSGGLGIQLVRQRITYIYGEEFGLSIRSEIGRGTAITLKLCTDAGIPQEEHWKDEALHA